MMQLLPYYRRRVLFLCAAVGLLLTPSIYIAAPTDVVLRAASGTITGSAWSVVADATAAGGERVASPNAGAATAATAASPASYVELTFDADAGVPYRLWLRMKSEANSWKNDSVFVQFSNSVTSAGAATWRIGTTSSTTVTLEDCTGCGVSGWGWQDNGAASTLGPLVYFAASGPQRIRIQVREDGASIDQVVLSPTTYLNSSPGALKNDATILTGGGPPPPPGVTLTRQPYLHQVTDHSAVIVWASREPGPASARVGGATFPAASTFFPSSTTGQTFDYYLHQAAITGLSPATTYAYDVFVGSASGTSGTDSFRTAPLPGTGSASFIVFGDAGTGSTEQRALANLMAADPFDVMLVAGDIVYGASNGTGDASFVGYEKWFFDIYKDTLRRKPLFPTNGNHDSRPSTSWGRAYLGVYVLPEDAGSGAYPDHAERYYSFDYGPVHFVALDSELALSDAGRKAAQLEWLEADLATTTQPWKIAFFHRAPYSSGTENGSTLATRQAFQPVFERHGVQVALTAHDHDYERLVPWRESTDPSRSAVLNIVSGGGGAPLYVVGQSEWTAFARSTHLYLKGTVSGCVATFQAIDKTGTVFDTYSLDRCAQASDVSAPTVSFSSPTAGATVSGVTTVTADAEDDVRVEKVDLWVDGALRSIDLTAPYQFSWDTSAETPGAHTLELRTHDIAGKRATASVNVTVGAAPPPPGAVDIVIRAGDVAAGSIFGDWVKVADATAADGVRLWNQNRGAPKLAAPLAAPVNYFEATFEAQADTPYHLWLRLKADGNSWANDSVYVQFSGSVTAAGAATFRSGTSSGTSVTLEDNTGLGVRGWGWNDNLIGGVAAPLYFTAGPQTIRIQVREDGASIDQIVLSPGTYLNASPGALKDDATVVAR